MGLAYWIVLLALVPFVGFVVWAAARFWRGEVRISSQAPEWFVWGDELFRGGRRALPVLAGSFALLEATAIAFGLSAATNDSAIRATAFVLAVLWIGSSLVACSIVLFNEPKRLVPPMPSSLRNEPGIMRRRS